ncbi:STAS domain-containing protein [Streptomyces showdoensis]|uniref:STAS domain-containing protein n=1 Tax=Streptomyces showdoensis TaxID=68268 RepID=UPI000F5136AA|nr:STAS domain-containing protein [Streptomyces showdoensis]
MTQLPTALHLTTTDTQDTVRIEITGDLDYDSADLLLSEVTAQLSARPGLKDLHLHCAQIGIVDSMGLSILLMIRRRTTATGTRLHLHDRPAQLTRLLDLTGTLDYLTAPTPTGAATPHPNNTTPPPMTAGEGQAARPTGPDGTT